MAESSESAPKAMDLYLGVVDLFGTLLPGLFLAFVMERLWGRDFGLSMEWPKETSEWVAFLVVSYIAGHLIDALGSVSLDPIYDFTYKLFKTGRYSKIRVRALEVAKTTLGPFWMDGDNILEWSRTFLRMQNGALSAAAERLEADSKFFRSLTVALLLAWPLYVLTLGHAPFYLLGVAADVLPVIFFAVYLPWKGPDDVELKKEKQKNMPMASGGQTVQCQKSATEFWKVVEAHRALVGSFETEARAEEMANTKLSRHSLLQTLLVAMCWAVLVLGWAAWETFCPHHTNGGVDDLRFLVRVSIYVALTLFAAWRFMEQRLKRTELTYQSVIALFILPGVREDPTEHSL